RSYLNALEAFSRIQRRIESTNRMFLRTLKALQDLQKVPVDPAARPAAPATGQESSEEAPPLTLPIGFVPLSTRAPAGRSDLGPSPARHTLQEASKIAGD